MPKDGDIYNSLLVLEIRDNSSQEEWDLKKDIEPTPIFYEGWEWFTFEGKNYKVPTLGYPNLSRLEYLKSLYYGNTSQSPTLSTIPGNYRWYVKNKYYAITSCVDTIEEVIPVGSGDSTEFEYGSSDFRFNMLRLSRQKGGVQWIVYSPPVSLKNPFQGGHTESCKSLRSSIQDILNSYWNPTEGYSACNDGRFSFESLPKTLNFRRINFYLNTLFGDDFYQDYLENFYLRLSEHFYRNFVGYQEYYNSKSDICDLDLEKFKKLGYYFNSSDFEMSRDFPNILNGYINYNFRGKVTTYVKKCQDYKSVWLSLQSKVQNHQRAFASILKVYNNCGTLDMGSMKNFEPVLEEFKRQKANLEALGYWGDSKICYCSKTASTLNSGILQVPDFSKGFHKWYRWYSSTQESWDNLCYILKKENAYKLGELFNLCYGQDPQYYIKDNILVHFSSNFLDWDDSEGREYTDLEAKPELPSYSSKYRCYYKQALTHLLDWDYSPLTENIVDFLKVLLNLYQSDIDKITTVNYSTQYPYDKIGDNFKMEESNTVRLLEGYGSDYNEFLELLKSYSDSEDISQVNIDYFKNNYQAYFEYQKALQTWYVSFNSLDSFFAGRETYEAGESVRQSFQVSKDFINPASLTLEFLKKAFKTIIYSLYKENKTKTLVTKKAPWFTLRNCLVTFFNIASRVSSETGSTFSFDFPEITVNPNTDGPKVPKSFKNTFSNFKEFIEELFYWLTYKLEIETQYNSRSVSKSLREHFQNVYQSFYELQNQFKIEDKGFNEAYFIFNLTDEYLDKLWDITKDLREDEVPQGLVDSQGFNNYFENFKSKIESLKEVLKQTLKKAENSNKKVLVTKLKSRLEILESQPETLLKSGVELILEKGVDFIKGSSSEENYLSTLKDLFKTGSIFYKYPNLFWETENAKYLYEKYLEGLKVKGELQEYLKAHKYWTHKDFIRG